MGSVAASVAGSVVSGYMANQAAKKQAGAINEANRLSNMGYLDAQPYIQFGYKGGKDALNDVLAQGAYTGPTYAGLNNMQNQGLQNQYNFGNTAFGYGSNLANQAQNYGANYNTLYNNAMGNNAMNNALAYADQNTGALTDAALRDSTRMLTQNTLPGINRSASGSGNTNSSRAGVADAIAMRDYADRAADTAASIRSNLIDQSLGQQQRDFANAMSANQGLASAFNQGITTGFGGAGNMINAGAAYQKDDQNQMNADMSDYQRQRDFELDQYNKFMSGILGRAPTSGKNYVANTVDPTAATIGGAMTGFGLGGQMYNMFNQPSYNPATKYTSNPFMDMRPSGQLINAPGYSGFGYMSGR